MTEIKDKVITKDAFALPYTIIKAKNQPTKGAIVYIHGGGLMFGKANDLSPQYIDCLLYTSPSPRDVEESRLPSSA